MMRDMPIIAQLSWELEVECPGCHNCFDLESQDNEGVIAKAIFNNKWGDLKGYEAKCPICGREFFIDEVEY